MAVTCGFFNAIKNSDGVYDRLYNSEQISDMFKGLISNGVYEAVGDALIVKQKSGMTVELGTGRAIVGDHWMENDSKMDISLAAAHMTLNRWSAIVMRCSHSDRIIEVVEKVGENATNPVKPEIENTRFVEEKCLAYIYVKAGTTSIVQADITDTRADTDLCGWVTGIVKQVDTHVLFLQWQDAYDRQMAAMKIWEDEQKADFETWFSALSEELQVNTFVESYSTIVEVTADSYPGTVEPDVNEFKLPCVYADTDIIMVNLNGIVLHENTDYVIDGRVPENTKIVTKIGIEVGNVIGITVLKSIIGQP